MNKNQNGFGIVAVLLVIIVLLAAGATGWQVIKHSNDAKKNASTTSVGQQPSTKGQLKSDDKQIATIKGVDVQAASYYKLTLNAPYLATGDHYYGKVQKINDNYLRLYPTYYDNASGLTLLGNELHAPEPVMYIATSIVSSIEPLATTDAHYQAIDKSIKSGAVAAIQDAFPSSTIDKYIDHTKFQAVFFDDGKVYFSKLTSVTSTPLFTNPAGVFTFQSSGNQVTLLKADATQAANYKPSQIVFWENLKPDGQVSKALNEYLKAN